MWLKFVIVLTMILGSFSSQGNFITTRYTIPIYRPIYFYNARITPLAQMGNVVNRFGFNVLAYHSLAHSENIAFSPCGLGSVLVALFEGTEGPSAYEIYRVMHLPENRNIIRVGYRDIHRRLRSYFYQEENLLSGLTLNRESVVIRTDYELVLRFYGFDLDSRVIVSKDQDKMSTTTEPPVSQETSKANDQDDITPTTIKTTKTAMTTIIEPSEATATEAEITTVQQSKKETSQATTLESTMETTTSMIETTTQKYQPKMEPTTRSTPTVATQPPDTTTIKDMSDLTTLQPSSTTEATTTQSTEQTTQVVDEKPATTNTEMLTEMQFDTETTPNMPSTVAVITSPPPSTLSRIGVPINRIPVSAITQPSVIPRSTTEPTVRPTPLTIEEPSIPPFQSLRQLSNATSRFPMTTNQPPRSTMTPMYVFTFKPILNTTPRPNESADLPTSSRNRKIAKRSKSYERQSTTGYGSSDYEPSGYDQYDAAAPNYEQQDTDYYFLQGNPNFVPRDFAQSTLDNQDEINHVFYLNPSESIQTVFRVYNTLLRFAYFDSIKSSILEVPLDSDNYNLLLILPDGPYGLDTLTKQMATNEAPSISDMRAKLKSYWIKAMVPKFQLKGNVLLTSALMKMGITNIFDPSRADFSPMTDERGTYAKHIEQSINLNIRTQTNNNLRRFAELYYNPIQVSVNQPFMFCVVDTELELAIMMGRIVNPLNSRIM